MTTNEVTHSLVNELTAVRVTIHIYISIYLIFYHTQLATSITTARMQLEDQIELDSFYNWLENFATKSKIFDTQVITKTMNSFYFSLFQTIRLILTERQTYVDELIKSHQNHPEKLQSIIHLWTSLTSSLSKFNDDAR